MVSATPLERRVPGCIRGLTPAKLMPTTAMIRPLTLVGRPPRQLPTDNKLPLSSQTTARTTTPPAPCPTSLSPPVSNQVGRIPSRLLPSCARCNYSCNPPARTLLPAPAKGIPLVRRRHSSCAAHAASQQCSQAIQVTLHVPPASNQPEPAQTGGAGKVAAATTTTMTGQPPPWWQRHHQTTTQAVGTLKDGYVRNVPLPRVPRRQGASYDTSHELIAPSKCIQTGTPLPDYLPVSRWIPTLPKLGRLLGFSKKIL